MDPVKSLVIRYINLAHSISDHLPDYIDTYFGPKEWVIPEDERKGETIPSLGVRCEELLQDIQESDELDAHRKKFMLAQVQAMQITIRILAEEELSLEEKIEGLFDVTPARTPESEFLEMHKNLDELLPPGGPLQERMSRNYERLKIPEEKLKPVFEEIASDLKKWTYEKFELPPNERFELQLVTDKPWTGYSEYLGEGASNIEVNIDMPISILFAIDFLAHEIYPGHHTESAIKETELIFGQGREELYILLALSPFAVSNEGIAMHARDILLNENVFVEWLDMKILPMARLEHLDARRQLAIENIWRNIRGVTSNAVFMYWVDGEKEERIYDYVLEYSLRPIEYVENFVKKWLKHPVFHLYSFNYLHGYRVLDRLFSRTGDPLHWFGKLLNKTYLPSEIETLGIE